MRKSAFSLLTLMLLVTIFLSSCKDDAYLAASPAVKDQTFTEEFDTVSSALSKGWKLINVSDPANGNVWQQGGDVNPWFSPYSSNGSYAGFIGVSALVNAPAGVIPVISNWLVSPLITMQNGDKISFYTRTAFDLSNNIDWGNRLQLRINTGNESVNVGSGFDPGDFKTILLDINPNYNIQSTTSTVIDAYPSNWTRFEGTVYGLDKPVRGHFAFRYYIEDAANFGWGIGIDQVTYTSVNHK